MDQFAGDTTLVADSEERLRYLVKELGKCIKEKVVHKRVRVKK